MTVEEIKKIAMEWGAEVAKNNIIDDCFKKKVQEDTASYIIKFLQHLLRTHTIIPKTEKGNEWTLCKDKLPPKSDKCVSISKIVYLAIEHKNSYGTKILYAFGGYSFVKEKWFSEDWNLNDESMKVVAWLPLPKFNPDNYKEI